MVILSLLIDYDRPNIDTYRKVVIQGFHIHKEFNSGDVVIDFANAYTYCYQYPDCEEIVFHDSCELFVMDSNGMYAFNSDAFLAINTHYAMR